MSMHQQTPSEALRSSRSTPEAFGDFYRHQVPGLFRFFGCRVFDADVAMDLTAETFAQAFVSRTKFRGRTDEEAAAWLFSIASRQLSKYFRREAVERRGLRKLRIEPPSLDDDERIRLEDLLETESLRTRVSKELGQVSAPQRDALALRVVEELPYSEVALRLEISEQAARARVMRGLRALSASLKSNETRSQREF